MNLKMRSPALARGLLVLPALLLIVSNACLRMEFKENKFENSQALQESDLVEHGWVPADLPISATDIHEAHDLDVGRVWMRFTVANTAKQEIDEFLVDFEELALADFSFANPPVALQWWFDGANIAMQAHLRESGNSRACVLLTSEYESTYFYFCSDYVKSELRSQSKKQ